MPLAFGQDKTVSGKIIDPSGEALPGVNIVVKGTTRGVVSDMDGNYTISAPAGATLTFSYIGYLSQEVIVGNESTVNITLQEDIANLEEVVVIGYGTVKRSDATGSVATVSSRDFNKGAITTPQELLVGKSAGVVITSEGGAPGSGATIRIRGGSSLTASNDPLIVIDGIPVSNESISGLSNPLSIVNPNDIETFTVLKDASATAIYGSRASNGVILITTKRGKAGKARFSYNGNVSVSSPVKFLDVLSGDEYRALAVEKKGTNNIDNASLLRLGNENTIWQKEIYESAVSHDHNLSASGTANKIPYRASLGYTDQNGILKNTDMQRTTLSLGVDPSFFDNHLKINVNAKGMHVNQSFGNTGAVGSAVNYDPTQPVRNGNTRYGGYTTWTLDNTVNGDYNQMATSNPLAMVELTDNESKVNRGIGNIQFDYKFHFLPELSANLNVGIDYTKSSGHNNADTTAIWTRRSGFGQLIDYNQEINNKLLDFTLHYVKDVDAIGSRFDIMGGYSWQHFWRKGDNYQRSIEDARHPLITADSSNYATENYLVSFFGRLNYTLMNKYLFTATIRDDGSSRFSEDNRWGLFPSVALAWKINEETFLKNVRAISELKLRLGWGQTGQQNIGSDYPFMGTYRISVLQAYYQFGDRFIPTLRPNAYDPDIKWETTTTKNIGLDFSLFNDRVSGSVEYYKRETKDLLNTIAIPNGSNFSNYLLTNVGNMENTGYEIILNVRPVTTSEMSWTVGMNLGYNKNEITKLTRTDDPNYLGVPTGGISGGTGNNIQMNSVGYPINSFFVNKQVYDVNGFPIEGLYVDLSGKGGTVKENTLDMYHYKKPAPDYTIGITSRFEYKSFDFSFSGRANIGNYVYNNIASSTFYGNLYNNSYFQNLTTQISNSKFNNSQYLSDFYLENASFFRMDNMSVGYNFQKIFTEKLKGRLNFTVQNAFVITKYNGLDPEVSSGIDNNIYPRPRTFILGVNLDF
jgi:iron complex outermembrane receptor protein